MVEAPLDLGDDLPLLLLLQEVVAVAAPQHVHLVNGDLEVKALARQPQRACEAALAAGACEEVQDTHPSTAASRG